MIRGLDTDDMIGCGYRTYNYEIIRQNVTALYGDNADTIMQCLKKVVIGQKADLRILKRICHNYRKVKMLDSDYGYPAG